MHIGINGTFWHQETTGSGQYVRHLVRELAALQQDRLTICLPRYELEGPPEGLPAATTPLPLATPLDRWHPNLAKVWFEQVTVVRACEHVDADLFHVPYLAPPWRTALPTVVTIFDLIPLILPRYRGSKAVQAYMRLVSRAAHRADLIITDSHASARDIQRLLGIPETRIRVIYLAASEIYRPLPEAEREPVLARYGIGFPYLLYLGGFDCRKNVLDIVRAYAQVSDTLDDVRLVIAGRLPHTDSAFAPDPRRVSDELGLGERVHYAGWIAEEAKPALYSGALAFCFPSRYEGFGLPVLEAIACGTPAIIGSGSSLEEVGGAAALSVPPGDIDRLSEAMQQLVEDARLHERLSKAGLAHASRFSWKKTARKTRRVYEEVVGR